MSTAANSISDCIIVSDSRKKARPEKGIKHYVFDIEGTTTPISFVKDILFPYAADNVLDYLTSTWEMSQTKNDVKALIAQSKLEEGPTTEVMASESSDIAIPALVSYVKECIKLDKKVTALKALQGHMWSVGYDSGKLKSIVYPDILRFFERHSEATPRVHFHIYSSGSRQAQKCIFQYSDLGDLQHYISAYFDTKTAGMKREAASYDEIALSLGMNPCVISGMQQEEALFLTDIWEEATAARLAGWQVVLVIRPGNTALPSDAAELEPTIRIVHSMDELA